MIKPIKFIKHIYQRLRYGVSYKDSWNLEYHLSLVLWKGLEELLKAGNGYPADYDDPKEWENELRKHSNTFKEYYKNPDKEITNDSIRSALTFVRDRFYDLWD